MAANMDSRGVPTKTLPMVYVAFAATTLKFLASGLKLGSLGAAPEITAQGYGWAVLALLGVWQGREWIEKVGKHKGA